MAAKSSRSRTKPPFIAKMNSGSKETVIRNVSSKSYAELYAIGIMLESIAAHGVKRHPRTPVWSLLAEMARDIQIRSAPRFLEERILSKEQWRPPVVKQRRLAA